MLWILFNEEGQKLYEINTGNLARAGSNDFEIYAVFQNVNLAVYATASIKLYRPDLSNSSYAPLSMVPKTGLGADDGIVFDGDTNPYFTVGVKYYGFYFNFAYPNTVLLDTSGLWNAVVTLYSINNANLRNVVGRVAINVGYGITTAEPFEIDNDALLQSIYAALGSKLDIASPNYLKALDKVADYDWSIGIYNVGDVIYIKNTEKFYKVNSEHNLVELSISGGGGSSSEGTLLYHHELTIAFTNSTSISMHIISLKSSQYEASDFESSSFVGPLATAKRILRIYNGSSTTFAIAHSTDYNGSKHFIRLRILKTDLTIETIDLKDIERITYGSALEVLDND